MKKRALFLIVQMILVLLISSSCTLLPSSTNVNVDSVGTAVSSTVNALITSTPVNTPEEHVLATATQSVTLPLIVSFVDSARNLYVWKNGSVAPVELANSGDVVQSYVSPDGNLVVFSRSVDYTTYELDVINSDGSNQRTLISAAQLAALPRPVGSLGLAPNQISWIPNSHRLGISLRVLFEGPGLAILDAFYTLDADSGALTQLLNPGQDYGFGFSPNGAWLVISRPTGMDLYTAAGVLVKANVVSHDFVNTASEYAWRASPSWQNDSSNFIAAIPPVEPWVDSPAASLVWKVANSGISTNTFTGPISFFPDGIASFNPALTQMAFRTQEGAPADNKWALHISNIDGSADTILDTGYFHQLPVWSPEGNYYIYSKLVDSSTSEAYLASSGSSPTLLPDVISLIEVRWVDDSHYLVSSQTGTGVSLLFGTIGQASGVIFNDPGLLDSQQFSFDVNR